MEETTNQATLASSGSKKKNTVMAVIAYILFFIPLLTDSKNDPFVKYHVKQGLVLFICEVILSVVGGMPIIYMFSWILHIILFALFVIGILNALSGKEKPLPLVGQYASRFNF